MISHLDHANRPDAAGSLSLLFLSVPAVTRFSQSFDVVGTRALGMGGAFVAVADDASATWWNPAGLPNSLIVDGIAEGGDRAAQKNRRSADF